MIKFISIADIHFNKIKNLKNFLSFKNEFIEKIKIEFQNIKNENRYIVIAGDLYDNNENYDGADYNYLLDFLIQLSYYANIIYKDGNHDLSKKTDSKSLALFIIDTIIKYKLNKNKIYFYDKSIVEEFNDFNLAIFAHNENNIKPTNLSDYIENKNKPLIGVFHDIINGCKLYNGLLLTKPNKPNVSYFNGLDIVICGDIHKRQIINKENPFIYYTGSPYQINYGETVSNHGYASFDIIDNKIQNFKYVDLLNQHNNYLNVKYISSTDKIILINE